VSGDAAALKSALRAARRGDVAAFNTLVLLFQRQVYNVCYRTLGNPEDAADATQDAFLAAFRGLKTFNGPAAGLRPWLLRVSVNTCYDHLRRRQRRPSESLDRLTSAEDPDTNVRNQLPDPALGPEHRALSAETERTIQAALQQLPHDQRVTVVLFDVQGLTYEEVALATNVELGTVKSRLSRARARMRDLLVAAGELPASGQRLKQEQRRP
jgi:RNA polymerase sigma factor (sigma-70 family)